MSSRRDAERVIENCFGDNILRWSAWAAFTIRRLYRDVDTDDIDGSFREILPLILTTMVVAKRLAVLDAWRYLAEKALLYGVPFGPLRPGERGTSGLDVTPLLLAADRAASGVPLATLNARAPLGVKALIGRGVSPADALDASAARAISLARSEVPLMGRTVPARAVTDADIPAYAKYRRVPSPGACSFCLSLAARGAVYTSRSKALYSSSGGRYHPNCQCRVEAELDRDMFDMVSIHEEDLREIRVRYANHGREWVANLGADYYRLINRAPLPTSRFLPLDMLLVAA